MKPKVDVVDLLQRLVRVNTVNPPGNELEGARALARWLSDHGIEAEIDEFLPGRANLTARVRGRGDGPTLMLNTHLDVVPAGDGWSRDPLAGAVENGRVYGRGAADSKGSLAAMAAALVTARDAGVIAQGELVLAAVADEESGSAGARHLLGRCRPDAVIVGEPTGLRLVTAHKGSLRPVVEVRGRAAHAAQPQLGASAVEAAADLLRELRAYAGDLGRRAHPLVGPPTLTAVLVQGGEALNAVPERCRITFDRRLIPGETEQGALEEFKAVLARFAAERPGLGVEVVDLAPSTGGPSETAPDHPFVAACRRALRRMGQTDEPAGLVFNCDMSHFHAAGVPAVVYGPGSVAVMHAADEYVDIADLEAAVVGYVAVAAEVLGEGST